MEGENTSKVNPNLLQHYVDHKRSFQKLQGHMADYLNKVKQLKDAMDGVHASVLALTENDGTGADEFSIRLEDQVALWSELSEKVQNLGPEFESHSKQLHLTRDSLMKRKGKLDELKTLKKKYETMDDNTRVPTKQMDEVRQLLEGKEKEYSNSNKETRIILEEVKNSKQKFIINTYRKFLSAHTKFCEQTLQVHESIPDILSRITLEPKKITNSKKRTMENI